MMALLRAARLACKRSLRLRLALALGGLLIVAMATLAGISAYLTKGSIIAMVTERETIATRRAAAELDRQFNERQSALRELAADLAVAGPMTPQQSQAWFMQHHSLNVMFANLTLIDMRGIMVANMANPGVGTGFNFSDRAYFKDTVRFKLPVISAPLISKVSDRPVVVMTMPVADRSGAQVALIAATVDLGRDSFVKQLAATRFSDGRHNMLVTSDGIVVAHPDEVQLLTTAEDGAARALRAEAAAPGKPGIVDADAGDASDTMLFYQRLASTDWILISVVPTEQVLALPQLLNNLAIVLTAAMLCLFIPLAWFAIGRQLSPMTALRERIAQGGEAQASDTLAMHEADELDVLGQTFDTMLAQRDAAMEALAGSEQKLRMMANHMPAMIAYIDVERRYRFCNDAYEHIRGMRPAAMLGKTVRDVFGDAAYSQMEAHIAAALQGERVTFEKHSDNRWGGRYWQYDFIPDVGDDGTVLGFYSMATNITEHKLAAKRLSAQQRMLRSVTDSLPALVNFISVDGTIQFANRQHEAWLCRSLHQIEGHKVNDVLGRDQMQIHRSYFKRALAGETCRFGFQRVMAQRDRHFSAVYVPQVDAHGAITGVSCLISDVTEAKTLEKQLHALARLDALTGLPNRMQLDDSLARAVSRSARTGAPMGLLYLDLDNFKAINDNCGHACGDQVLQEFAKRLLACVRKTDTVARLGGDEFVVLLEGMQAQDECEIVARKVVAAMARPFHIGGVARTITTSIGIAATAHGKETAAALLQAADKALYQAKEHGRNQYALCASLGLP